MQQGRFRTTQNTVLYFSFVSEASDKLAGSVVDPDPYDPYVFVPPGSPGSVSHKNGSGSGSFHHQAKIVRKTIISTVL